MARTDMKVFEYKVMQAAKKCGGLEDKTSDSFIQKYVTLEALRNEF